MSIPSTNYKKSPFVVAVFHLTLHFYRTVGGRPAISHPPPAAATCLLPLVYGHVWKKTLPALPAECSVDEFRYEVDGGS